MFDKKVKLNSGYEMPMIGLGTWMNQDENKLEESIRNAIKVGYRHIDTALIYENEKMIGKILKKIFSEGEIKREDLFITSKLWNSYHDNPELGIKTSLKDLQLDYLDLYLIHWPVKFKADENCVSKKTEQGDDILDEFDCLGVWRNMEKLVENRLAKSIGVANFGIKNCSKILDACKIKPAVNQFEIHPYLTQNELVDYCKQNNIQVISYSSLGGTVPNKIRVKEDPEIIKISEKYKKTVLQVILSWLIQRDILVIPKSTSESHIKENGEIFTLEDEDFNRISELNSDYRYVKGGNWGPELFD
ncbi:hypothetical protein P3W45_000230 [Vairimorpha bombi]